MREYPPLTVEAARSIIDDVATPSPEGGVQYAVWLAGEISDRTDLSGDTLTRAEELRDTLIAAAPHRIQAEGKWALLTDVHAWLDGCDRVSWMPAVTYTAIVIETGLHRQYVYIPNNRVPEGIQ